LCFLSEKRGSGVYIIKRELEKEYIEAKKEIFKKDKANLTKRPKSKK
jgi:hypothetical protein